ncbi:Na+/H+ antiporter subunit G [Ramlibacter rhizophilus]|uniref:Na+/H+ antiporter subunit G n=2 Tax=Ramlibacter rhizophilus TaxID=1781167 RepID=A0A4Z0C4D4_9BURK|nr:Na+/H+ antiporter subunit G [Ramlibacter rhizophilus]
MLIDGLSLVLLAAGLLFFLAGTVGLLRFPDVHSRLHALTKADNLGLGFIALAMALQSESAWQALKLMLVWLLALLAAATAAQLVARSALVSPQAVREEEP